jgi:hypothetical protein
LEDCRTVLLPMMNLPSMGFPFKSSTLSKVSWKGHLQIFSMKLNFDQLKINCLKI